MSERLYRVSSSTLENMDNVTLHDAIHALESGNILYFPDNSLELMPNEKKLISESVLDPRHKNISFNASNQQLCGVAASSDPTLAPMMSAFMQRYVDYATHLVETMLPQYRGKLICGRTSYRPAEIKGRNTSPRKDDTRLHVDAFPATPVNGLRILRVFCNINPHQQPRVWEIGESFNQIYPQFAARIPAYSRLRAHILHWIKATKTLRSHYDHVMLHVHDKMKLDLTYQRTTPKMRIDFPVNSTWIVFTDQASHAALSGQYLLEQTFYLPVSAMHQPELAPLSIINKRA